MYVFMIRLWTLLQAAAGEPGSPVQGADDEKAQNAGGQALVEADGRRILYHPVDVRI